MESINFRMTLIDWMFQIMLMKKFRALSYKHTGTVMPNIILNTCEEILWELSANFRDK